METTGKLAEALAKAQASMKPAAKDAINPHFKSRYADLAAITAAIRGPLTENSIAWVQLVGGSADGASVSVETRLLHSSGEALSSVISMPVTQKTPQAMGSALTYARRYALSALVGLESEVDDDGNAASAAPQVSLKEKVASKIWSKESPLQQRQDEVPPPSDADAPPMESEQAHKTGITLTFGKHKGKDITDVNSKDLAWLEGITRENANNPEKSRFKQDNLALADAISDELKRRS